MCLFPPLLPKKIRVHIAIHGSRGRTRKKPPAELKSPRINTFLTKGKIIQRNVFVLLGDIFPQKIGWWKMNCPICDPLLMHIR